MPRFAPFVLCFALAASAPGAFAQQANITPGLWQLDVALPSAPQGHPMAGPIALMKSQMASMAPEQRKQMEKMLGEMGARGTELTGDGVRTRQCITREDIARFDLMGKKGPDSCTRESKPAAGGIDVSMICTKPQMKVDAAVKFQGEKAYTFDSVATLAGPDGKMVTQKTSGSGKWLSSDCGSIKPASAGQ